MAFSVGQVDAQVGADITGFMSGIRKVHARGAAVSDKIAKSFSRVGDSLTRIGSMMTATVSAPLVGAGALAVKTAADFETLRQSMDILNGSVEEGARNFQRLKKFSARTPFQLKDLAKAQNTLQGFSLSADDAFESISMIGDIAAVTGGDIQAISVAFGQAAAEGKLLTRDIRQLVNQGVPAVQLLADSMGVATSEIFDMASQGKITFSVLQDAFRDATREGGLFANGMQKQSQTIAGVFSTLKDNVSIALADLGNSIVDTLDLKNVIKGLTNQIQAITSNFNKMSEGSKKQILAVAAALVAGGPLLVSLGIAAKAVAGFATLVTSKFTLIAGAVGIVVVAGQNLADNWEGIMSEMGRQTASWAAATQNIFSLIGKTASFFGRSMPGAMQGYFIAMDEAIMTLQGLEKDSNTKFTSFSQSAKNAFGKVSESIQSMINSLTGGGLGSFLNLLTAGLDQASQSAANFKDQLMVTFGGLENVGMSMEGLRSKMAQVSTEGSITQVALKGVKNRASEASQAGARMGNMLGDALSQALLHSKDLLGVIGNLVKQFASRTLMKGLSLLLAGPSSYSGGFFKTLFGGLFHSGGVVGGTGERMVKVRSGEGVFTKGQMAAMGMMATSGGSESMSEAKMQKSFEKALTNTLNKLGPNEIYALSRKGQAGF